MRSTLLYQENVFTDKQKKLFKKISDAKRNNKTMDEAYIYTIDSQEYLELNENERKDIDKFFALCYSADATKHNLYITLQNAIRLSLYRSNTPKDIDRQIASIQNFLSLHTIKLSKYEKMLDFLPKNNSFKSLFEAWKSQLSNNLNMFTTLCNVYAHRKTQQVNQYVYQNYQRWLNIINNSAFNGFDFITKDGKKLSDLQKEAKLALRNLYHGRVAQPQNIVGNNKQHYNFGTTALNILNGQMGHHFYNKKNNNFMQNNNANQRMNNNKMANFGSNIMNSNYNMSNVKNSNYNNMFIKNSRRNNNPFINNNYGYNNINNNNGSYLINSGYNYNNGYII